MFFTLYVDYTIAHKFFLNFPLRCERFFLFLILLFSFLFRYTPKVFYSFQHTTTVLQLSVIHYKSLIFMSCRYKLRDSVNVEQPTGNEWEREKKKYRECEVQTTNMLKITQEKRSLKWSVCNCFREHIHFYIFLCLVFFFSTFFPPIQFRSGTTSFLFSIRQCISVRFNIFFSRFCSLYAIQLDSTVIGFFFLLYYPILGQQANATK